MIIELARLRLRPFRSADVDAVVAGLNDWAVAQWVISPPYPYRHEDFQRYAQMVGDDHANECPLQFAVARRASDELVGSVGVALKPGRIGELGYWFSRSHWGQGFATEASLAVIAQAMRHRDVSRLFATIDPQNEPSRRVLAKIGFVYAREYLRDEPTRRGTFRSWVYEFPSDI